MEENSSDWKQLYIKERSLNLIHQGGDPFDKLSGNLKIVYLNCWPFHIERLFF